MRVCVLGGWRAVGMGWGARATTTHALDTLHNDALAIDLASSQHSSTHVLCAHRKPPPEAASRAGRARAETSATHMFKLARCTAVAGNPITCPTTLNPHKRSAKHCCACACYGKHTHPIARAQWSTRAHAPTSRRTQNCTRVRRSKSTRARTHMRT